MDIPGLEIKENFTCTVCGEHVLVEVAAYTGVISRILVIYVNGIVDRYPLAKKSPVGYCLYTTDRYQCEECGHILDRVESIVDLYMYLEK